MTVHRRPAADATDPSLEPDELAFDLDFSDEHQEREIVAYRKDGIIFTFEAGSVTFGAGTQTSEAIYDPPMTADADPARRGATAEGHVASDLHRRRFGAARRGLDGRGHRA